ncbi:MAG: DUF3110 domain-containing protein [Microcystis panniformis Mp_MB_F_20051200_S9]|uniref:DUF3110 domain-containing protein n=1 Tax=Microcystis panniformis Mp_MB_F_20051200_S9 TaxID=2486223 RepID=A0A552PMX1_9CHRO|nr:MAG: DUF3110 domain-containing protein [Microcystis panniformis Mp_GB_SS_20050300_S99D]TRV46975.1 MAG: DUF3110 domain-containing protein [Microcystis panniformis Mp_MB_F_20080800_S26D]TRV48993.1 MAG: DUF3110 domain-containing protein [Microcystis panniformis Mp_GB_SS_20050300_S99]TRV58266.1 MAG: DUF3110 domain-containing protein [Microcystis panniformis Mp_MB_F_20051200_S9]TRV63146.1 MAG: DUF3110 domain-containing protein [Microcystis panniformis Mp_MB_F_20051200_S9D]TRV64541.1 MAG: DUF3110
MNEQRAQAYVNLIQQLLTCADDEELNNILQANQELIDHQFLQVMENYATGLEQQGNNNPVAWLRNMAQQLGQYLNPQAYSTQPSNQLPQSVYVLLYNSGTDNEGIHTISHQGRHTILMFESSSDATNFARQLREHNFPVPSVESILMEEIIAFCKEVSYDWEVVPEGANKIPPVESIKAENTHQEYFIFLMKTLEKVYENPDPKYIYRFFEHNLDKLDENLIIVIDNWVKNQLVSVETEQAMYIAGNIFTLIIFSTLIQQFSLGNIATNLEIAIAGYQVVLTGFNFDDFPEVWADTQDNLGSAYQNRIRGDIAENLELSINAYTEALKVRTFDKFPKDWADTQNNLANTYSQRIRGDRAENLELAIAAYIEALKVRTFDKFPEDWATTQHNLALAYAKRIRGNKAENSELAIATCSEALKVRTIDRIPQGWANTKNTLANAYADRIKGDKAENLELAIKFYNEVLQVRTYDKFPKDWAGTKVDLANAYADRIRGNKEENLEKSISSLQEALRVYTRDAFPYQWAITQNNLGTIYGDRIRGKRADNLKLAISAYNLSLEVRTPTAFPINCLITGRNLGDTANLIEDWETAIKGYNLAIEAVENTRLEALNPQRQQEILSEAMDVYHGIVQSYLNLNQKDRALEYVERSKTRYLVQLLTDRDIYPKGDIPPTIKTELDRLRRAIIGEEQQLAIQEQTRNRGVTLTLDEQKQPILNDYTHLNHLKQELNQFIASEIAEIDKTFSLTQKVELIPFQDILSLTDTETCLLQWYITGEKILAFVVSADGNINLWESSEDDRNRLTDLINNYLQLYYSQNGHQEWINQLANLLQDFSDNLHINDILTLIPNTCKRLIIIPYLFLHILPLHALPINQNQILQDKYDVQYAPSCQLFKITQQRQLNDLNSLFAIQNPQNNLLFTDLEVEIIKNLFVQSDILAQQNATEIAIKTHQNFPLANCIHFSCHGTFNPNKPLESALILTKEKTDQEDGYLRLGEIFELNFKNCRLVMLSACETGLIDLNSISDEYIGLPSGFLFAGSPSVVSSLWKVNDLSTAFLLIKFYETLPKNPQKGEIAVSLKNAQKWLQTLTLDQFEQELERFQLQLDKIINQLGGGKRPIFNESLKQIRQRQPYPFKNPYYWAGFIATGF